MNYRELLDLDRLTVSTLFDTVDIMDTIDPSLLDNTPYKAPQKTAVKSFETTESQTTIEPIDAIQSTTSNPYVVQHIYKDRLMRNGFVEEEESVSVAQEKSDCPSTDKLAGQENDCREKCDETNLKSGKETVGNAVNNGITVEQKGKEGLDALGEYLQAGIRLIGAYDSGAVIASGNEIDKAFTHNISVIKNLW